MRSRKSQTDLIVLTRHQFDLRKTIKSVATMEKEIEQAELAVARNEITQLKQSLLLKATAFQDLEMDMNFHVIKTAELTEILQTRGPDETRERLTIKALQNAELTVQVQALRHHLNNSAENVETLEADLRLSTETVQKLAEERKSHQRMLVELSDVVRTLGRIEVEYDKSENKASNWMAPDDSLENIKRKINAMEEDRQRRIQENEDLQIETLERGAEIEALHRQNLRIEAIDQDRQRLLQENQVLREDNASKVSRVETLEQLLHENKEERGTSSIPHNVTCEQRRNLRNVTEEGVDAMEVISQADGSTEIILTTPNISRVTRHVEDESSDSDSSFSSLESPEPLLEDDIQNTIVELVVLRDKYTYLQAERDSTKEQMESLEKQLQEASKKVKTTQKKQEIREGLLQDVIFHYKQLQKEHDEATTRITELEGMMSDRNPADDHDIKPSEGRSSKKSKTKTDGSQVEDSPSSELTVTSRGSSCMSYVTTDAKAEGQDEDSSICGVEIQYFDETMMDEFHRLESECARLEHEYDDAIARVSNLEDELKASKQETVSAQDTQKARERDLDQRNHQYEVLQHDHESALEKTVRVEDDLLFAQIQAEEASTKQKQREQDLLEVIDQYKQQTSENDETRAKMEGVENELDETQIKMADVQHELKIAKKHANRRDLIYDYRRLEQDYEDSVARMEGLEIELRLAKTDAARSKEESKSTRKRLAGCHFHYKQLQQQYDDALSQTVAVERALTRAQKHSEIHKAQTECWTEKLVHIREKRAESNEENKRLLHENKELKTYCNDLLTFASEGIECL
jgi:chromosome segregation ATPase